MALSLCILSYYEHLRSVRPSTIVETYVFFSVATDAVQVRTLWLQYDTVLAGVMSASLAIKIAILVLEARCKRQILMAPYAELSPETTSGFFSRSTFYWLNGLFRVGFASIIDLRDLPKLDSKLLSKSLREQMQQSWNKSKGVSLSSRVQRLTVGKASHSRKYALLIATFRSFWVPFLEGVLPRLALISFNYSQPFLITRIIDFVGQPDDATIRNDGYGLIGATAILYIGAAVIDFSFSDLTKHDAYLEGRFRQQSLSTRHTE